MKLSEPTIESIRELLEDFESNAYVLRSSEYERIKELQFLMQALEAKAEKAELYEKALELCAKEIQPVVVFGHKPIYGYNTAEHWLEKAREGMNRE